MDIWQELGISGGTAIIILIVSYWVIKGAVKNGMIAAFEEITGKDTLKKLVREMNKKDEIADENDEDEGDENFPMDK